MRITATKLCFGMSGLLILISGSASTAHAAEPADHVAGRLLVGHIESADPNAVAHILRAHQAVTRKYMPGLRMSVLEVPEEQSENILQSLRNSGLFEYVERDYVAHTGSVTPNDPNFPSQWHLAQISAPAAWNLSTGSASIVAAVIDSGVDGTHPDLKAKLVPGWNFVDNNSNTGDVLGHGTAVAGTIAAASNNGIGVAGVTWNTLIMPLVVVDENDYASYSNMAAAIQYAADHRAKVINLSLGGPSASFALQNAVNYASNKGATIFAAAMNNGNSDMQYPAACTSVVAVSATDNTDRLASFSSYGGWITLSAPGTNILTTNPGGGYGYWMGTSFSSPIAAGVAALALAVNPALTNSALVALLEQTADDLGPAGIDPFFGWGRVNAFKALTAAQATLAPATISISPLTASVTAGETRQFQAIVTGGWNPAVTWSMTPAVGTLGNGLYTAPAAASSTQTVTVTATLSSGASASATVRLNRLPATTSGSGNTTRPSNWSSNFTPIRVNSGGQMYTDPSGIAWALDYDYIGGSSAGTSAPIGGPTAQEVYQSCRWGRFLYQFPVPNGNYTVNLKFAEIYFTSAGSRIFNASINGTPVLTDFDIVAAAGGPLRPIDESFPVTVTNGRITIQFSPGPADQPLVSGIEISARQPVRPR